MKIICKNNIYIYIYIYREREREREIEIHWYFLREILLVFSAVIVTGKVGGNYY